MPLFDSGEGANVRIDQQPDLTVEIVSRQRGYLATMLSCGYSSVVNGRDTVCHRRRSSVGRATLS